MGAAKIEDKSGIVRPRRSVQLQLTSCALVLGPGWAGWAGWAGWIVGDGAEARVGEVK